MSGDRGLEDVLRGGLVVKGQLPAAKEGRARGSGAREAQGGRGHSDPGPRPNLAGTRPVHQTDTVSARQSLRFFRAERKRELSASAINVCELMFMRMRVSLCE